MSKVGAAQSRKKGARRSERATTDVRATHFVAAGEEFVVLSMSRETAPVPETLTDAERQVFRAILDGLSNAEIARQRGTTARTAANQVAAIFRKLAVGSRTELVATFGAG